MAEFDIDVSALIDEAVNEVFKYFDISSNSFLIYK